MFLFHLATAGMGSITKKVHLFRSKKEIEFYDYGSGEYRTGDVQSIVGRGSSVEVEVYDDESGEVRTFEMEDD